MERNTILYAEDDKSIRDLFIRACGLFFPNYKLAVAKNGNEAELLFQKTDAGLLKLIFLDDLLGEGKTGSKLTLEYHNKDGFQKVPFIISSGTLSDLGYAKMIGTTALFPKPYDISKLKEFLGNYLNQPK